MLISEYSPIRARSPREVPNVVPCARSDREQLLLEGSGFAVRVRTAESIARIEHLVKKAGRHPREAFVDAQIDVITQPHDALTEQEDK